MMSTSAVMLNPVIFILLLVVALPILCVTIIVLAAIMRGGSSKKRAQDAQEETRLIQEMHRSLNHLEERIEAIETIVVERERSKDKIS